MWQRKLFSLLDIDQHHISVVQINNMQARKQTDGWINKRTSWYNEATLTYIKMSQLLYNGRLGQVVTCVLYVVISCILCLQVILAETIVQRFCMFYIVLYFINVFRAFNSRFNSLFNSRFPLHKTNKKTPYSVTTSPDITCYKASMCSMNCIILSWAITVEMTLWRKLKLTFKYTYLEKYSLE